MQRMQRMKTRNTINSDSALPKVAAYLEYRLDSFFGASYLVEHVDFDPKEDGIGAGPTRRDMFSLAQALASGVSATRSRRALNRVSQLKMMTGTGDSVTGTYYGIRERGKPQIIFAEYYPGGEVKTEFYINAGHPYGGATHVKRVNRSIPRRIAPKDQ